MYVRTYVRCARRINVRRPTRELHQIASWRKQMARNGVRACVSVYVRLAVIRRCEWRRGGVTLALALQK